MGGHPANGRAYIFGNDRQHADAPTTHPTHKFAVTNLREPEYPFASQFTKTSIAISFLSKLAPSSASIQKEYVEKRQRALYANDPAKTEAVKKKVEALMAKKSVTGDWHDVYLKIHRGLRAGELTINIDAGRWFLTENTHETYGQMYQRAVGTDGKMVLTDKDPKNPALTRARTDDVITVPDDWGQAHRFSQRKRLYKALHATGAKTGGGLATLTDTPKMRGDSTDGYTTKNRDFKPKAKQVFAGLNYGRRPHGSTTEYGFSHLVLKPGLKDNALYYPQDTFYLGHFGTKTQVAFNVIGALLEYASPSISEAFWKSCYEGHTLPDISDGSFLVEAHIFKEVKLSEDVQALVLSRQRKDSDPAWTEQEWNAILTNATKWCGQNNARLTFATP